MILEERLAAEFSKEPWRKRAACLGVGNAIFFPKRGESRRAAKKLCTSCPVRAECKDYAERTNSDYGIWGGEVRSP